jgi:uncharacterized protein
LGGGAQEEVKRTRHQRWLWSGTVLAAGLGVLVVAGYVVTLPAVPSAAARILGATPPGAELVSFRSRDGIDLKGWWMPARGSVRATVILAHGRDANRSFMVSRARFLVAHGYDAFPIDLRGHGESGGRYMTPGSVEALDILGAVDAARGRGAHGPFVVLGHSSGAVAALHAAARTPEIAAVIADGAFISADSVLQRVTVIVGRDARASAAQRFALRMVTWLLQSRGGRAFARWAFYLRSGVHMDPRDADALPAIAALGTRPVLFIVGAQDALAPPDDARRMYAAAASPTKDLLIVPDAGHNTTYSAAPELYQARVLRFLGATAVSLPAGGPVR